MGLFIDFDLENNLIAQINIGVDAKLGLHMKVALASGERIYIAYLSRIYTMRTLDLTPLYRNVIGADRMARLFDSVQNEANSGYPPYNIEVVDENEYRITLALAGFKRGDLDIKQENNVLTVSGGKAENGDESKYLYQGIGTRDFKRKFQLAEHVEVKTARLEDGLLHVDLVREIPEEMKPRSIAITSPDVIDSA